MSNTYIPISLPSRCLLYPGIDPAQVQIRTLRGADEKVISEINNDNFEKKFQTVLRGVLQGVDPLKLTIGDRLYLVLWETINSYSKDFIVDGVECESCWNKVELSIDLSKLEVINLPEGYKEPYPVKLPDSGDQVNLRLLRIDDILKVDEYIKLGQNAWLYRYALTMVNDKGIWDNVTYLEKLSTKDLMHIRAFHDKFVHGPVMEAAYECPKCGGNGVTPVPFRIEMLLPFGKKLKRYIGDAV